MATDLRWEAFPRSSRYEDNWVLENEMGPNPLWLAEAISKRIAFQPNERVMDLGCGKALTSIFLAKEFGVQVWATDLWIQPHENWKRICESGVEGTVYPIYAEAHQLPYAHGFFDKIVSFDAYHYFGTDVSYLEYVVQFLKPDGLIGVASPAYVRELHEEIPAHLHRYWEKDWYYFHSAQWWREHWERPGVVEVLCAESLPEGPAMWQRWLAVKGSQEERKLIEEDRGELITFFQIVARKR